MAGVTAAMVKDLRERTGAGMMDCKVALAETGGDMEAAVDWLRKKGLAKAAKKSGRTASEGLVAVAVEAAGAGAKGVVVEVNSETDFVARNEVFQKMVSEVARAALATDGTVEAVRAASYPGGAKTVEEHIAEMVGQIGENMTLRRAAGLAVEEGVIASYIHGQANEGLGRIGVLVGLKSSGDEDKLAALGRQLAMHVAAARPLAARVEELDPAVVERERAVLAEQARGSGKPEEIIAKMVEGRLRKFYEESVLLEQIFVVDGETRVAKVIENAVKDVGAPVELAGFVRLELGEGVEKADEEE
ncbi:translation elongation factor Ts [Amphiplicatus metriothermophilus]|uniref:Elongation factor Ts n=1 Tax=Amphiplicatus metriothermophilus TaxID=1519374 RepID=A0A239PPV1_9PROT|nr:translation elongation factor Ts [Amphiplicatus metriothermophilus]MBB5518505.1 elongation factor Ts [Amphiplicatus metriothermophilus]SNT72334.1 translation elongation factor Ts (EF-Ts) [Amphiplicatus metriothermophilus]